MGPMEYIARGWSIFPCHAIVGGRCNCSKGINCQSPGKHPRTHNGVKDSTTNPATVQAWMSRWPEANWGVACGRTSGIVVVDIDPRKDGFTSIDTWETERPAGPLPSTLRSTTGGAGRHLFFAYPDDHTIGNRTDWLPGVDIKSDGGYVILPPGTHISGGRYDWVNWTDEPVSMPSDLAVAILSPSGGDFSDLPSTDDVLKGVPEGQRDDTLFRVACRWRRQLGDNKAAVITLALQSARNCEPPFPDDQAIKCVESAFRQDHTDNYVAWQGEITDQHSLHELTDLGNARRFVDHFGADVIYVDGWGWLTWTDIGWQRDGLDITGTLTHKVPTIIRDEATALAEKGIDNGIVRRWINHANASESAGRLSAITAVAKSIQQIRGSVSEFDSDDMLIACRNGVLDLRTGTIRPIDRDDYVTKNTGVLYDPSYVLPAFDKFMYESCDGDQELVDYIQRAVGYTLTGSNKEEVFFMLSGPPASGKSTFLDGVHAALGSYATTSQSDTFMHRRGQPPPANELARLAGMRLVSVSEIRQGESFNEAIVKQFTGGDRVTARFLYQDSFEFRPQFKLWVGTNHDPNAKDDALWRRIKKIPFRRAIPFESRDPKLKLMLRDPDIGGRAVLAWAVRGAMAWHEQGLGQPSSITAEIATYRMDQDRDGHFISECIAVAPGATTSLNEMFNVFTMWCASSGEFRPSRTQFQKMMESRGFPVSRDDKGLVSFKDVLPRNAGAEARTEWS